MAKFWPASKRYWIVNDNRHLVAVMKSAPAFPCSTLMQWSFLMEGLERHLSRQREVISTLVLSIVKRISVVSLEFRNF
jgi:hypothetical protein